MPLVVILEEAEIVARAAPRRCIQRGRDRFAFTLDEFDPESLSEAFRHTGAGARVDANHDLECDLVGRGLAADRRNGLFKKKPARSGTIKVADQTFTVNQASGCGFALSGSHQFGESGGNGSVDVTTATGCAWTANTSSPFIHITTGASGIGSGSVTFTVDQNLGGPRTDTITIAGQSFTINQDAIKCFIPPSAKRKPFDAVGGDGTVLFDLSPDCSYSATTTSAFLTLTSGTIGSGPGTVAFTIDANADADPRAAVITIKAQSLDSTFTSTVVITELGTTDVHYGDITGDNVINVVDLVQLANILAGNTHQGNMQAADVNFDHKINVLDLLTLANALAGNLDLPVVSPNPAPPIPVLASNSFQTRGVTDWTYCCTRRWWEMR